MLLLIVLALAAPAAGAQSFDRLVVFGTSLSDPGNAFVLLGSNSVPPDYSVDPFLVPDRPYARGGHHFSNGATWIEQLARSLGMGQSAQPAMRSNNTRATNYAVGSGRARDDGKNFNLEDQVLRFLDDYGWVAPSSALYVMEMGANDARDALVVAAGGGDPSPIVGAAITAIVNNIVLLYSRGAREFLVWTVPNVGLTPAVGSVPGGPAGAAQLAFLFNANLDAALAQVSALPGIHITRLDVNSVLNSVVASPQSFGLKNVSSACITPNQPPFVCRNPDAFLFWDGIHPTAAAHAILARAAAAALP
jgi:phospholipase/lecithinase/hemolysin